MLVAALFIAVAVLIIRSRPQQPQAVATKRVGILNLGSYPLMDTITKECEKRLLAEKEIKISPTVLNAEFQQEVLLRYACQLASGSFDVLIAVTTPAAQVLIAENDSQTPLVFTFVSTPSEIGVRDSNSLPNVTGLVDSVPVSESIRLAKSLVGSGTIGYIVNDGEASAAKAYQEMAKAAQKANLSLKKLPISSQGDVRSVAELAAPAVQGFMMGPDSMATSAIDSLLGISNVRRIPVVCTDPVSVQRGCLIAVAPDYARMGRRTAEYAIEIMKGQSPNSLPIIYFDSYQTYVNQGTVQQLALKLPSPLPGREVTFPGSHN